MKLSDLELIGVMHPNMPDGKVLCACGHWRMSHANDTWCWATLACGCEVFVAQAPPHRYVPSAVRFRCEVCSRPPQDHAYRAELRRWRRERDSEPSETGAEASDG